MSKAGCHVSQVIEDNRGFAIKVKRKSWVSQFTSDGDWRSSKVGRHTSQATKASRSRSGGCRECRNSRVMEAGIR